MKKTLILLTAFANGYFATAQKTLSANVYPSNLEENMYFDKYNAATSSINGIYFLVLSDGDNSKDVTPAFDVSLYLMPEGKSSKEDLIMIKTYNLDGIYHMGSHEFKNESVSLKGIEIVPGNYRMGIWVNSANSFQEEASDNAILFKNTLRIGQAPSKDTNKSTKETDKKGDDDWGW